MSETMTPEEKVEALRACMAEVGCEVDAHVYDNSPCFYSTNDPWEDRAWWVANELLSIRTREPHRCWPCWDSENGRPSAITTCRNRLNVERSTPILNPDNCPPCGAA